MNERLFSIAPQHLVAIAGGFALYVLGVGEGFPLAFLPLVALCGCGDGGGGDSGGGDSSGGGSSGGDSSSGGPSGCGLDCGGTCCGNGPDHSTPFLCTWDGERFVFENDFLFGKPASLFPSFEEGRRMYEGGNVTPDFYRIQNESVLKDGHFLAEIREIEPEESYIDYLSLLRVTYPARGELIVGSKFDGMHAFDKDALRRSEGIAEQRALFNGIDASLSLGPASLWSDAGEGSGYFIEPADQGIEIRARVKDPAADLFLLLRAQYRDWTAGVIYGSVPQHNISSLFEGGITPMRLLKGAVLIASISLLSFVGAVQSIFRPAQGGNDAQTLARAFELPRAFADIPYSQSSYSSSCGAGFSQKSLVIEYKEGDAYTAVDIVSPRYYKPSLYAVSIPKAAIGKDGEIEVRIRATKRHKVHAAFLAAPREKLGYRVEKFAPTTVFHRREKKDYTAVVAQARSKDYLHTIPGDVIDVSFGVAPSTKSPEESEAYVLESGGIYTSASKETQLRAGNWVEKLDPESQAILRSLYTLDSYQDDHRRTILS